VIAILFGLGTAACWATTFLTSTVASRRIGARSTLAGVMLTGIAIAIPLVLLSERPSLRVEDVAFLSISGLGNVFGLLMSYTAARLGKVSIVGPITSTEGAIAAVIAVIAGEQLLPGAGLVMAAIVVGIVLAAREPDRDGSAAAPIGRIVALAVGAAVAFGLSIYATGRVAEALPLAWAILPARLAGTLIIALPMLLRGGLGITRSALPFVIASGVAEVLGAASFAIGSRESIAVTAVIASQFPAIAGIGAFFLFRERLSRIQLAGVVIVAIGVAVLAALRA
jgi:drug/metabolite transporter (DMT)-like permease